MPPDLELRIRVVSEAGRMRLSYELHSPSGMAPFSCQQVSGPVLQGSPEDLHHRLLRQIEDLGAGFAVDGALVLRLEVQRRLEGLGRGLWQELFTDEMRQAYRRFRETVRTLQIISDEPWIPWEMIKPFDNLDPPFDDEFLAERFELTRWLAGNRTAPGEIAVKALLCVAAGGELPQARAERDVVAGLSRSHPGLRDVSPVSPDVETITDLLQQGGIGLVHFAGHCSFKPEFPDEAGITLPDGSVFRPLDLCGPLEAQLSRDRPLVFLNACQAGRQAWSWTSLGGWAHRCVRTCGCGAFVAPQWAVRDSLASEFAKAFYAALAEGESFGQAGRSARAHIRRQAPGDPSWLAYSIYANVDGRLTLGDSVATEAPWAWPSLSSTRHLTSKPLLIEEFVIYLRSKKTVRTGCLLKAFHYQNVLFRLEQGKLKAGEPLDEGNELENILDSQAWCAENAGGDDVAAVLCSKLAGVAGHWLEQRLNRVEQIRWIEAGLAAAEKLRLVEDQIVHLTHLGFCYFMNGNSKNAIALIERGLQLGRELGDRRAEAVSLYYLGTVRVKAGQLAEGLGAVREASATFRDLHEFEAVAGALNVLGYAFAYFRDDLRSLEYLDWAVDVSRLAGLPSAEAFSRANRASTLVALRRFAEAREDLDAALKTANRLCDAHLRGYVLAKLAVLRTREGAPSTMIIEVLEEALKEFRQAGDRIHELEMLALMEKAVRSFLERPAENRSHTETSGALRKLAEIHTVRQEHDKAHSIWEELLQEAERVVDLHDQLEAWIQLGRSSVSRKEHGRAASEHQKALAVLATLREVKGDEVSRHAECELWLSLGQAQRHLEQPRDAVAAFERARNIAEAIGDEETKWKAVGNLGLVYVDLQEFDKAIVLLEMSTAFFRRRRNRLLEAQGLFKQAYAHYRKGDVAKARQMGEESRRFLEQICDPSVEEVRRQMKSWGPGGL